MKLIGKGTFTKAYLCDDGKVLLRSQDPIKECMAHGWFPDSELFPTLSFIDSGEYKVKYYPKVKSLKDTLALRDYKLYQALRKLGSVSSHNPHLLKDKWHENFDSLPTEFEAEKEVLNEALDACGNYGTDIQFEISPRNVAVDNGKLILLDCFFLMSTLKQVQSSKSRRVFNYV